MHLNTNSSAPLEDNAICGYFRILFLIGSCFAAAYHISHENFNILKDLNRTKKKNSQICH